MRSGASRPILLLVFSVFFVFPVLWMLVTSLKPESDLAQTGPLSLIPNIPQFVEKDGGELPLYEYEVDGVKKWGYIIEEENEFGQVLLQELDAYDETDLVEHEEMTLATQKGFKWSNYSESLDYLPEDSARGARYVWNSVLYSVLAVLGTVFSSSLVAYGFARLRFPGKKKLFVLLISTMMLPSAVTLLPRFMIFRWLGWIDTLLPLWVPMFFGSAFSIFMLRQFFLMIPKEMEDAAKIDGCGYLRSYWSVLLPQVKPALVVVGLWAGLGAWNDFLGPLTYIQSPEKMPISYALQAFSGEFGTQPHLMMTVSFMSTIPLVVVFWFTQNEFVRDLKFK